MIGGIWSVIGVINDFKRVIPEHTMLYQGKQGYTGLHKVLPDHYGALQE